MLGGGSDLIGDDVETLLIEQSYTLLYYCYTTHSQSQHLTEYSQLGIKLSLIFLGCSHAGRVKFYILSWKQTFKLMEENLQISGLLS